jgi:hypothetical protein
VLLCAHVGAKGGLSALDLGKANWQKISRKGDFPSTRCGSAVTMYKNKALLFGGVFDEEGACLSLQGVRRGAVRCYLGAVALQRYCELRRSTLIGVGVD